jgi:hypothetical protein
MRAYIKIASICCIFVTMLFKLSYFWEFIP